MNELNNSHSWTFLLPVHYLGLFVVGMSGCLARKDIERFFSKINLGPTICDVSIVLFGIAMMRINFMDSKHPILAKSAQFWLIGILAVWILTLVSINSKTSRFARILNTKLDNVANDLVSWSWHQKSIRLYGYGQTASQWPSSWACVHDQMCRWF